MIQANKLSSHGYDHNGQPKLSKSRFTQDWSIGNTVKVGFLSLFVKELKGNIYILESTKGTLYEFEPHIGLNRIN